MCVIFTEIMNLPKVVAKNNCVFDGNNSRIKVNDKMKNLKKMKKFDNIEKEKIEWGPIHDTNKIYCSHLSAWMEF